MGEYYAVERSSDYLAHYGIRGMKWGVRKAIERGNGKALSRQYVKAQKKLAKLEKRATSGKKYAKRAAALGAGAAAAGGLAIAGTNGVAYGLTRAGQVGRKAMLGVGGVMKKVGLKSAGNAVQNASTAVNKVGFKAGSAVRGWGNSHSIGESAGNAVQNAWNNSRLRDNLLRSGTAEGYLKAGNYGRKIEGVNKGLKGVSNNTIARIGAGALGAGLGAAAGYNAYRAATTKRAAKKAAQFRSEMNKAFKGTQYANGGKPRQGKKRRR